MLRLLRSRIHPILAKTKSLALRPLLTILLLLLILQIPLQGRLIRSHEKSATVRGGVVDKLPLVVMIFFIEFANRRQLAGRAVCGEVGG